MPYGTQEFVIPNEARNLLFASFFLSLFRHAVTARTATGLLDGLGQKSDFFALLSCPSRSRMVTEHIALARSG
jgi:hypothetical protein